MESAKTKEESKEEATLPPEASPPPIPTEPQKPEEGSVAGVVATAAGPLASATVWFAEAKAITDTKGRFTLEHVPVGTVTLRVIPPTPRFLDSPTEATVVKDKKTEVFLFLRESVGTVQGVVTEEDGAPIPGAMVFGFFHPAKPMESVTADEKGQYLFEGISPGSHFIRASAPGFMTEGKSLAVTGGKSIVCSFSLRRGSIALKGKVVDQDGTGLGSEVYLLKAGIVVTKVETKTGDGGYLFSDLVPAVYELTIVAPGFLPTGWRGDLSEDKVLEFKLEKQEVQPPAVAWLHGVPEAERHASR